MTVRVVVGHGRALDDAFELAEQLQPGCRYISLSSSDSYNFELGLLCGSYSPQDTEVFVALDERAVNYARQKLIADIRLAGYQTYNLVSPNAVIEGNVRLMGNVHVGAGCNIAKDCVLGMGSWLDRQVILDHGVKLGHCVTLRAGVVLANHVQIGSGSTLGAGTFAAPKSQVGKYCEWLLGGKLPARLQDRSFFDALMPEGAHILT
ncbi:LbetaH domain-containing protein [Xanthomonas arboricola]|uniref:acetyltransferase n=1 Tax=Xanthomonas arboricola TaxID=56448 RepID=UPI002B2AD138|nr:acetyltransferase [Xanthomonas arboricola]